MTVSGIESTPASSGLTAAGATTATASTASSTSSSKDKDMFLQLMVAQMKYQDPSNPTDTSAFLSQTAQFTALEKMEKVAEQTAQLVTLQTTFGASSMVGRTVAYAGADGSTTSGTVSSVRFEATGPILVVDGQDVALSAVSALGDGSTDLTGSAATPAAPTPASPSSPATSSAV